MPPTVSGNSPTPLLEAHFKKTSVRPTNWMSELVYLVLNHKNVDNLSLSATLSDFTPHKKYLNFIKLLLSLKPNMNVGMIAERFRKITKGSIQTQKTSIELKSEDRHSKTQIIFEDDCHLGVYFQFKHENKLFICQFNWNLRKSRTAHQNLWHLGVSVFNWDLEDLTQDFSSNSGFTYVERMGLFHVTVPEMLHATSIQFSQEYFLDLSLRATSISHYSKGGNQLLESLYNQGTCYATNCSPQFKVIDSHLLDSQSEIISYDPTVRNYKLEKGVFPDRINLAHGLLVYDYDGVDGVPIIGLARKYDSPTVHWAGYRLTVFIDRENLTVRQLNLSFNIQKDNENSSGISYHIYRQRAGLRVDVYEGDFVQCKLQDGICVSYLLSPPEGQLILTDAPIGTNAQRMPERYASILSNLQIDSIVRAVYCPEFDVMKLMPVAMKRIQESARQTTLPPVFSLQPNFHPDFYRLAIANIERRILRGKLPRMLDAIKSAEAVERMELLQSSEQFYGTIAANTLSLLPSLEAHYRKRPALDPNPQYQVILAKCIDDLLTIKRAEIEQVILLEYINTLPSYNLFLTCMLEKQQLKDELMQDMRAIVRPKDQIEKRINELYELKAKFTEPFKKFLKERELLKQLFTHFYAVMHSHMALMDAYELSVNALGKPITASLERLKFFRSHHPVEGFTFEQLSQMGRQLLHQVNIYKTHLECACSVNANRPIADVIYRATQHGWNVILGGSAFRGSPLAGDLDIKLLSPITPIVGYEAVILSIFKDIMTSATKITGIPELGRLILEFDGPKGLPINMVICFFDNEKLFPSLYIDDVIAKYTNTEIAFYHHKTQSRLDLVALAKMIVTQKMNPERAGDRNKYSATLRVIRDVAYQPIKKPYNVESIRAMIEQFRREESLSIFKQEINYFLLGDPARGVKPKVIADKKTDFEELLSEFLPEWRDLKPPPPRSNRALSGTRFGLAKIIETLGQVDAVQRGKLIDSLIKMHDENKRQSMSLQA